MLAWNRFIHFLWLLVSFSVMPALAMDNSVPEKDTNTLPDKLADLYYHLPDDAFVKLKFSPNKDVPEHQINIPILRYEARTPITKGLLILIGDLHVQGNIDHSLANLAKTLPDSGWNTLFVTPETDFFSTVKLNKDTQDNTGQDKETEDEQLQSPADSQTNEPEQTGLKPFELQGAQLSYSYSEYQLFLKQLLAAIQQQLVQGSGYKLVMATGQSATVLSDILALQDGLPIDAIVVNNSYWPDTNINKQIPQKLAALSIPVLDLTSKQDNVWSKQTQHERVIAAKVNTKALYRQREISNNHISYLQTENTAKALIGWFNYLGW